MKTLRSGFGMAILPIEFWNEKMGLHNIVEFLYQNINHEEVQKAIDFSNFAKKGRKSHPIKFNGRVYRSSKELGLQIGLSAAAIRNCIKEKRACCCLYVSPCGKHVVRLQFVPPPQKQVDELIAKNYKPAVFESYKE